MLEENELLQVLGQLRDEMTRRPLRDAEGGGIMAEGPGDRSVKTTSYR